MRRTTYRRWAMEWLAFLQKNRRLLAFLFLFFLGIGGGVWVFSFSSPAMGHELGRILEIPAVTGGFRGGISVLFSSCFSTVVLLLILFLSGLSACGAPVTALVPLFFGLGTGLTEAYYYSGGKAGIFTVAILVIPHTVVAVASLVMGCAESLRMSLLISGQLLPSSANCGGLWQDFRLYGLRFLLFIGLAFGAGVLDVLMRLVWFSWIQPMA